MHMNRKNIIFKTAISVFGLIGCATALALNDPKISFFHAAGQKYTLTLANSKRISTRTSSYTDEISTTINTVDGNGVTFKASNVVVYNNGWQTINSGGYFYNPLDNSSNHNKISGIQSIKYEGIGKLSLYYGNSINDTEIIYSHAKELSPGVVYNLADEHPNYFYIKNDTRSNINITEFKITYSCSDLGYARSSLNVLMIGNSFADDTIYYAARVAASYGVTLNIYNSYFGGCTIDQHYSKLQANSADYSMRSMNGSEWVYNNGMDLSSIISSQTHWDVVTFQQASAVVGRSDSYTNLSNLVNAVKGFSSVNSDTKLFWHQTWSYSNNYQDYYDYFSYFGNDQSVMFSAINTCYQSQVVSTGLFDGLIPAGTAVQNIRTSYMKDTLNRDGKHMSEAHGRYLLSLNFFSSVFDVDLDLSPCNFLPTDINASYKTLCYESIRNAYKTPLSCTNSIYPVYEVAGYDLENDYFEIDAGLVGCSYWNSNERKAHISGQSNRYVSTKKFTSSELPQGSIIVIDEPFGVIPDVWTSDSNQAESLSAIYNNVIEINSSFFNGYSHRAFDIFKPDGAGGASILSEVSSNNSTGEQYDQVIDGFHIYVPNSYSGTISPKGENTYYNSDKTVFTANALNIDAFERIHIDPITGFYKCDSYYYLGNSYVDATAQKFICTRPFYTANGDLPENTVIIVDSGYQWRSDCWTDHGTCTRPNNVSTNLTRLSSSFMSEYRTRTFNVSYSNNSTPIGQDFLSVINHFRIYVPISNDIEIEVPDTVTMCALGYASLNSMAASVLGSSTANILIVLHGDDINHVYSSINTMAVWHCEHFLSWNIW